MVFSWKYTYFHQISREIRKNRSEKKTRCVDNNCVAGLVPEPARQVEEAAQEQLPASLSEPAAAKPLPPAPRGQLHLLLLTLLAQPQRVLR